MDFSDAVKEFEQCRKALERVLGTLEKLNPGAFEAVMCSMVDVYCSDHEIDPIDMANHIAVNVAMANMGIGPIDKK